MTVSAAEILLNKKQSPEEKKESVEVTLKKMDESSENNEQKLKNIYENKTRL